MTTDHTPLNLTPIQALLLILKEEVQVAIAALKEGKASRPNRVQAEFIKLDKKYVKWLTAVFNHVYHMECIPQEWFKSEFIILSKKPGAERCSDYRIISLMSHLLKLFLKIIHRKIYRLCEEHSQARLNFFLACVILTYVRNLFVNAFKMISFNYIVEI